MEAAVAGGGSQMRQIQSPVGHRVVSGMEGWPECFQDLRSWCHTDQDELHTPQITMQDEFSFGLDEQVNSGSWGLMVEQSPVENNQLWVNQDLLLASPNNIAITEEENNNFELQSNFSAGYLKRDSPSNTTMQTKAAVDVSTDSNNISNVLKTRGNVLLSQVSLLPEDSPLVTDSGGNYNNYNKLNSSTTRARLGSGGGLVRESSPAPGPRPKLKLHIPPAPSMQKCNLATPEVLKPFTDLTSSDFDLLNYVCGDSENGNRTAVIPKQENADVRLPDHDYADSRSVSVEEVYIKNEPASPSSADIGDRRSSSSLVLPMDYDDDVVESFDEDDGEEEWFPSPGKGKKGGGPMRRRGRKTSSLDSSDGSLPLHDRYRALRDRNNEASRRSRLNRKERDTEMRRHKSDLEKKNVELRVKADRMEALVKDMRAILLKAVRSRNQQQPAR